MLFDCLSSRDGEYPRDRHGGRTFPELPFHFPWIAPRRDRLIIHTNTAARVTRDLLPGPSSSTTNFRNSFVDALDLAAEADRTLRLPENHRKKGTVLDDASPHAGGARGSARCALGLTRVAGSSAKPELVCEVRAKRWSATSGSDEREGGASRRPGPEAVPVDQDRGLGDAEVVCRGW